MQDIDKFNQAIKNNEFIHAHELLEAQWKALKEQGLKKEAKALQGLINGATALALLHIKKRKDAYERIWAVYKKYKPLLEEIQLENIHKYNEASVLLEQKNQYFLHQDA